MIAATGVRVTAGSFISTCAEGSGPTRVNGVTRGNRDTWPEGGAS